MPPLPEGFVIDQTTGAPPEGFVIDKPPSKPSPTWDFIRSIPRGLAQGATSLIRLGSGTIDPETAIGMAIGGQDPGKVAMENRRVINEALDKGIEKLNLPKPSGAAGRFGETVGEFVGDPTSYLGPGGVARKAITAATGAIGSQAGGEVTKGTRLEVPARIAGAVLGAKAPQAAARAITPLPIGAKRAADVATLRREGVEPSAGDVTGRKAIRHLEETGDYFGGGQSYTTARERIAGEVTARVARAMGEQGDRITPEMLNRADSRIGAMFDHASSRLPVRFDQRLGNEMVQLEQEMMQEGLPEATIKRLSAQIESVRRGFVTAAKTSTMTGETYKALTSKGTPLARAIEDADPNVSYYATKLRGALDDAMERTAFGQGTRPNAGRRAALQELRTARSQWFHYLVARDAVSRAGEVAQEGLITPQRLRSELTAGKDRRMRYALDRSELADFARAGNVIMPAARSTGTAERLTAQHPPTLFGTGVGLTGRLVNSAPAQRWLKNQRFPGNYFPNAGTRALAPAANSALAQPDDALQ